MDGYGESCGRRSDSTGCSILNWPRSLPVVAPARNKPDGEPKQPEGEARLVADPLSLRERKPDGSVAWVDAHGHRPLKTKA